MVIVALHGFLGAPRDWDFLRDAGFPVVTPSVSEGPGWPGGAQDVILGYSMGGRLALQALLDGAKFKKAVFISTRVSASDEMREQWAQRFEHDDWQTLMRDWDAQPLFGGHSMPRREEDFDRRELARQLREWSPAVLPPPLPRLHELRIPTLWIAGGRDATYAAEARRAAELAPNAPLAIVDGAAHRVPR